MKRLTKINFLSAVDRSNAGWIILRITLAFLIAMHGWARFTQGGVAPFGDWLDSLGFPFGVFIASIITLLEIVGTPAFAIGRFVTPLALIYSFIYIMGIVLVHAQEGWFVVGHGGNGVEYSVLLIVCLLCLGLQHSTFRKTPLQDKK